MQTDPFEEYRSLLFALAYRMVGSAMEAEDIVQEAYLRYRAAAPESIRALKSFLTTIVHHLCLDHLRSAQVRRESYAGPWLPEPLLTGPGAAQNGPLRQMTDWESISIAFLVLLESLSPPERAVFLLREVFDYEYAEIAQITGRTETACRQLFSRAKKHIRSQRPRFPASPQAHADMVGRFMEACLAGDIDGLTSLLAEDVTAWMDGGGKVAVSASQPVQGRDKVARGIIARLGRAPADATVEVIEVNGLPALLGRVAGQVVNIVMLEVVTLPGRGDAIRTLRTVLNPDKLAHLKLPPTSDQARRLRP